MNRRTTVAALTLVLTLAVTAGCRGDNTASPTSAQPTPGQTSSAQAPDEQTSSGPTSSGPTSDAKPAASQSGSGDGPSSPENTQDAGDPGVGKSIDVCTVLPVATVAKITGQPYTTALSHGQADAMSVCAYNDEGMTGDGVTITASATQAEETYSVIKAGHNEATEISGLGDQAFWDGTNTLYVLAGANLIQITGATGSSQAQALATALLDAVG